jgi:hypothetical protein
MDNYFAHNTLASLYRAMISFDLFVYKFQTESVFEHDHVIIRR